tara:strand:- start:354 stop:2009 length:1656 start_codon:yes stop_codon:yes gene_type:complete
MKRELHLLLREPAHRSGAVLSAILLIQSAFVAGGESLFAQEPADEAPAQTESLPLADKPLHEIELSIEQAVEMGLARSFDVRIARTEGTIREREMVIQDAVFDPFFTLSANYSKNRRPSVSFLDIGDAVLSEVRVNPFESSNYSSGIRLRTLLGSTYSLTVGESGFDRPLASSLFSFNPVQEASVRFTATQPLLKGAWYPYNYSAIQVAENNRKLAMDSLETTISDLIFRIEAAYWQLVFSSRNYAANENSLKVATENVEKARKEEAAGTQPKIYVTTIEGQLARRKVEMNDALLQLENSRDNLLDLLQYKGESLRQLWEAGQKTGSFDGIRVIPLSEPTEQATLPERNPSLAEAFERRADYRQFAALLDNQKTLVDMRANERLPQLDLTGAWAQFGLADSFGDSFSSLGSGDFYGWTVGLQLAMPLSNRGLKSNYDRARDRYQQLKWQRLQTENRIIMEVDQSIRRLRSTARKLVYLDDLVRLKETELAAERRKLAAGASIPFTVNTIENDLLELQTQALQAKTNLEAARSDYIRATGGLLERYGVQLGR